MKSVLKERGLLFINSTSSCHERRKDRYVIIEVHHVGKLMEVIMRKYGHFLVGSIIRD